MTDKSWTYKDAGVDVEAGKNIVESIRKHVRKTYRPEVIADIGGFGGLFGLDKDKYKEPVLVSSTDGVGTKLKLAQEIGKHDTVGIDLVAMCVNDILVMGAEPLFFLDYIACGKVDSAIIESLVKGISDGCVEAGCALLGGETAEMPDMYKPVEYDLAGFAVGVVEKSKIIDGSRIHKDDVIVGLPSSGLHSNGYSLVRKLFPSLDAETAMMFLNPTRIYVKPILGLLEEFDIHGLAHITGGGITENIERLLENNIDAVIDTNSWPAPEVFDRIQKQGNIDMSEMFRTFNMGIGMTVIIDRKELNELTGLLTSLEEPFFIIGKMESGKGKVRLG
jgi:phosphoribosylformylglycinamidine cyclo-ligase